MEKVDENAKRAEVSSTRIKLCFRQGSFRREFRCQTIEEAIRSAGHMLSVDGCSDFRIVGGDGQRLLDQSKIVERCGQARDAADKPPPPEAA